MSWTRMSEFVLKCTDALRCCGCLWWELGRRRFDRWSAQAIGIEAGYVEVMSKALAEFGSEERTSGWIWNADSTNSCGQIWWNRTCSTQLVRRLIELGRRLICKCAPKRGRKQALAFLEISVAPSSGYHDLSKFMSMGFQPESRTMSMDTSCYWCVCSMEWRASDWLATGISVPFIKSGCSILLPVICIRFNSVRRFFKVSTVQSFGFPWHQLIASVWIGNFTVS